MRVSMICKPGGLPGVKGARSSAEIDAELFHRAENELAAFVAAVNTLHGEEQAHAAAGHWPRRAKTHWTLTLEAFERLLRWLSPDRDAAGRKYEQIRTKMVRFFN